MHCYGGLSVFQVEKINGMNILYSQISIPYTCKFLFLYSSGKKDRLRDEYVSRWPLLTRFI